MSSRRGGSRRGRRWTRPLPPPRVRACWTTLQVRLDTTHRIMERRRHRQEICRRVEAVSLEHCGVPGKRIEKSLTDRASSHAPPAASAAATARATISRGASSPRGSVSRAKRRPSRSTKVAPAPRTASEMSGAGLTPGSLSAVRWNCRNSMSRSLIPTRCASAQPSAARDLGVGGRDRVELSHSSGRENDRGGVQAGGCRSPGDRDTPITTPSWVMRLETSVCSRISMIGWCGARPERGTRSAPHRSDRRRHG